MKRLDPSELHDQLHDALRLEAVGVPAPAISPADTGRIADHLAGFLARFDIFDPAAPPTTEESQALPLFPGLADPEPVAAAPELAGSAGVPFGRWLLDQRRRSGWIGDLARAALNDSLFPADGHVEDVRRRLDRLGASGDDYEALDAAELDWLAL